MLPQIVSFGMGALCGLHAPPRARLLACLLWTGLVLAGGQTAETAALFVNGAVIAALL